VVGDQFLEVDRVNNPGEYRASGGAVAASPGGTSDDRGRIVELLEAPYSVRSPLWDIIPLVLVVVALLGSVAIPARQGWQITQMLRETTEVVAPARLLVAQLQSGLAKELVALQSYALSGDSALLGQYRVAAAADDQRVAVLERLATHFDTTSARDARALQRRIAGWRLGHGSLVDRGASRAEVAVALRGGQTQYDSSLSVIADLSSDFAAQAVSRDDRVRELEHLSIMSNAALVLAALVAMSGVLILTLRERRLSAILRRRAAEESSLRRMARRLSAAVTREEALRCVTEDTIVTTGALGAYIEWALPGDRMLESIAIAGGRAPAPCTRAVYDGSLTEEIARLARSATGATELEAISRRLTAKLGEDGERYAGLLTPLHSSDRTPGVLVLLRHSAAAAFGEDERRQLRLVSDLASATLRRLDGMAAERRALKEARRRARRERALRAAAESLAGAYTRDEVTQRIAEAALKVMVGRGAFVEEIGARSSDLPQTVVVRAVAGTGVPPLDTPCPLAGSYAELAAMSGKPVLITDLERAERPGTVAAMREVGGSAIVVPLGSGGNPVGALWVVRGTAGSFRRGDVARAGIFGHLAALAYEKVHLLEEAHDRRRMLERVIKSRSRLMRGFSHDVKNPIGAADGFAELLSLGIYGELSAEQQSSVDRMRRSIHGALTLIDDLHDLARAETGNLTISLASLDLADLVRGLREEYHAVAQRRGLSLQIDIQPDAPVIETDPARVRQIASNLVSNAIKYTEHGSVTVAARRARTGPDGQPGEWALLEIIDTGPGIPPQQYDAIFEEFHRLGGSEPGAGLGLAISKLLAQALGGHISVASEPGRGSTFTLWLPSSAAERRG
jgi:signal transduction histidine kinase